MSRKLLLLLFFAFGSLSCKYVSRNNEIVIPSEAYATWAFVKQHHAPQKGYVGGRRFGNYERLLPKKNSDSEPISYREWDIYPKKKGQSRGAERLVTSSDGNAYYTGDHYLSFTQLEP